MSMEEKQNSQTSLDFNQNIFKPTSREEIVEIVKTCYRKNIPLEINGLKSKNKIGRNFQSEKTLDLSDYKGIIDYKPEELYIKVKAGTPLKEIIGELDKNNQQLAFEPNDFGYLFSGKVTAVRLVESFHAILLVHEDLKLEVFEITYLDFKGLTEKVKLLNQGEQ